MIVDKAPCNLGKVVLSVKNVTISGDKGHKDKVTNVSFEVKSGEIVCIGIDGNGQSELIQGITGIKDIKSGNIFFNGKKRKMYN